MGWPLLLASIGVLCVALLALGLRKRELLRLQATLAERTHAKASGSHRARLQYPHVDLSRCLGCGACVRACPEEGVLQLVHGQAMVIHGARCVGHGLCAKECPTGAIVVTFGDLAERRDLPVLAENLEVPQVPGLFLAGEVTGYALIRTAIAHGVAVASEVARRTRESAAPRAGPQAYDLCIIGAGPAGLACALEAKRRGLSYLMLEQDELGGTVAKYPRRKLVMTQPVELPLVGELDQPSYAKEQLMELWHQVAQEQDLSLRTGVRLEGIQQEAQGLLRLMTTEGGLLARSACLALGRRGTPRKLGIPGEELPKVAYSLLDAHSYRGRRILVVGGGDSAVEAALALAEQPGNEVTLSYRKAHFTRLKLRNEARLNAAIESQRLAVLLASELLRIRPATVDIALETSAGSENQEVANDDVFIFAGGIPPFELLERCQVSFDPADRSPQPLVHERGSGLIQALSFALLLACVVLLWALWHAAYYALPLSARPAVAAHRWLAPSSPLGLTLACAAALCILCNLAYLVRRAGYLRLTFGSLQSWMSAHLITGILAFLLALVHGALAPRDTLGGHALLALAILVSTGAVGRYFYAFVPRAANGRELAFEEVQTNLAQISAELDRENRELAERVRSRLNNLVARDLGQRGFWRRLFALLQTQARLRAALRNLRSEAARAGLSHDQIAALAILVRRAQRATLLAAHYEDVRGLLATWRWLHRWVGLLLVLLVIAHIVLSLRYGGFLD